ncbi:MAG: hypothetical protein GY707_03410 [Desulfobacteraceae bacterium]|nr:hypothetical protein [Desulfobacteraceae bacterium]
MGKVCLLKAGNFLLGLNTSHIASTFSVEDFMEDNKTNKTDPNFLFLESFLAQKPLDIDGSEVIVLKKSPKKLTLLIDRTLGEIKLPDKFESYPLLYPELAMDCCPKVFIHNDQVVLLIDPKQLNKIHKSLETKHGLITPKYLKSIKKKTEQIDTLQPESSQTDNEKQEAAQPEPESKSEAAVETPTETEIVTETEVEVETETEVETEVEIETETETVTEINDKSISAIVAFIFEKFNQTDANEKLVISVDELPPGLIEQQGLNNELLQELIDKTILQCEKTRYQSMKNMIKNKLNNMNL